MSTKEYFQQSGNVKKRNDPDGKEKSKRETLKTLLFTWIDRTNKTIMKRELIDTETTETFFNKKWIRENGLEIEKSNSEELKLGDGNTKTLGHTIQREL